LSIVKNNNDKTAISHIVGLTSFALPAINLIRVKLKTRRPVLY